MRAPANPKAPFRHAPRKALGDSAITVVERIVAQASQFAVFIFAARMLSPAEFGVFALASACAILLLRAAEVAWAPYIMAWSGDARRPRQVLYLAILCGIVVAGAGQLAGLGADLLLSDPTVGQLAHLFSLWVMLATVSSAQKGVMIWQHKMKASAICEIMSEVAGLVVAIAALWSGYGIFALVFGRLAAQITHLLASFAVTRVMPLPGMPAEAMRELWTFSTQIFTSRMIANFRLYTATFVIGAFLGPVAVGLYRAADRLVIAFSELLMVPGYLMAWTQFRKARDAGPADGARARVRASAALFFKVVFAASLPLMAWLVLMSSDIIVGLLSSEWAEAAPLVAILAISRLLFMPSIATEPLLSITDQAKRLPLVTMLIFIFSLSVTVIAAQIGLYAVAWAQMLIGSGVLCVNIWIFQRYAGVRWTDVLGGLPALALPIAAGMGTLWALTQWSGAADLHAIARALGFGFVALVVYIAALRVLDPRFLAQILRSSAPESSVSEATGPVVSRVAGQN